MATTGRYKCWSTGRKPRPSQQEQVMMAVSSKVVTTQATENRTPG